jgi:hypothetical protein
MEDFKDELGLGRKIIYWFIGLVTIISVIGFFVTKGKEASHIDDAVANYEYFQDTYNTCSKINTDLCNMKEIPETDIMFQQFSKSQRILALKTNLNKLIEEYNGKSKMWGRSLWKSPTLPYQLTNQEFNCNN